MKILLVCNAGMSTGILQLKIQEEAQKQGVSAEVLAVPLTDLDEELSSANVILLGPQIKFAEKDIRSQVSEDIPVIVITAQDFGMMRADKIFADLLTKI